MIQDTIATERTSSSGLGRTPEAMIETSALIGFLNGFMPAAAADSPVAKCRTTVVEQLIKLRRTHEKITPARYLQAVQEAVKTHHSEKRLLFEMMTYDFAQDYPRELGHFSEEIISHYRSYGPK